MDETIFTTEKECRTEKGSYIPKPGGPTPLPFKPLPHLKPRGGMKPTCPKWRGRSGGISTKPAPGGGPPENWPFGWRT
jgi:hypothetical protein